MRTPRSTKTLSLPSKKMTTSRIVITMTKAMACFLLVIGFVGLRTAHAFEGPFRPHHHRPLQHHVSTLATHGRQNFHGDCSHSSFLPRQQQRGRLRIQFCPSTQSSRSSTTRLQATPTSGGGASLLAAVASSPIGALTVLAGIVLVHEAGHYLAARSYNITVEEFSIGFGPKLFGFEAWGNEFNLRALPLGGYVRFPDNYNVTLVQEQQRAAATAFKERREAENWTAGEQIVDALTLGFWDERRRQKMKEDAAKQRKQQQQQQQRKEMVASSNTMNVGAWLQRVRGIKSTTKNENKDDIDPEDFEIEYYTDPNLLQNRPWVERAVVLSMGVIFNLILSFTIYFGTIGTGGGLPQPVFDSGVVVSAPPMRDGPSVGLLQKGDVITSVNGKPLHIASQTSVLQAQKQVSDIISTIRGTPDGESIVVQVQRQGEESPTYVSIQPQRTTVPVRTASSKQTTAPATAVAVAPSSASPPSIGVFLSPNLLRVENLRSDNPIIAAQLAWQYLVDIYSQTLNGILTILATFVMGGGPPPGQSISGPIGLIKQGSTVVATKDWTAVLLFAAALSVNLGVINALPLPALDGGQLVFVIAEALTGRKVNQRLQEGITSVAILFLLWVSVSAAIGDVGNILSGIL